MDGDANPMTTRAWPRRRRLHRVTPSLRTTIGHRTRVSWRIRPSRPRGVVTDSQEAVTGWIRWPPLPVSALGTPIETNFVGPPKRWGVGQGKALRDRRSLRW